MSKPEGGGQIVPTSETAPGRIPDFRGEVVLVTGAAGFIGSHLVEALLERGARVRGLDNFATGKRENLPRPESRFEFLEADIRDLDACRGACRGAVYVFHQAALGSVPRSLGDPASTVAVNVAGTANILAAARDEHARRVVYASSSSVYGDSEKLPKKEGEEGRPLSPYALSKQMDEQLAEVFRRAFHLEAIGLRYFNVFGPRQDPDGPYAAVIPRFFRAHLKGEAPTIYGDGLQSRDFTFVDDAVRANLLAAGAAPAAGGRAYNVAGGRGVTVVELAEMVRELFGGGSPPRHEAPRAGDVRHSVADLTESARRLGYSPLVALSEGLAKTRDYYAGLFDLAAGTRLREHAR